MRRVDRRCERQSLERGGPRPGGAIYAEGACTARILLRPAPAASALDRRKKAMRSLPPMHTIAAAPSTGGRPALHGRWTAIALAIIAAWFLPYALLGQDAPVRIHDNLDSVLPSAMALLERDAVFSFEPVDAAMGGTPRSSLYAFYDLALVPLDLFGPYWGYALDKFLMALAAFAGMLLLLRRHVLPAGSDPRLAPAAALLHALLPFWSFDLTVAGLPLALCALLDIRARQGNWTSWLWLALWTWSASLVLSGVFLLLVASAAWLRDLLRGRGPNLPFFAALCFASLSFLASHAPLLADTLRAGAASHRGEFAAETHGFVEGLRLAARVLFSSQDHAWSPDLALLPVVVLAFVAQRRRRAWDRRILLLAGFLLATALLYGFIHWAPLEPLSAAAMRLLPLQWQRFHFLHPLAWLCLWALCVPLAASAFGAAGRRVVAASFVAALLVLAARHECVAMRKDPGFRAFCAMEQYAEVRAELGADATNGRVASIGLHPSIALLNGLRTVDGYFPDYPLEHKHRFRAVIAGELARSADLARYFDDWGSRCYAFSSELGRSYLNTRELEEQGSGKRIARLDYDWDAFRALGGRWILSAVPIDDDGGGRLRFVREFRHADSAWLLRLYAVD